MNEEAVHVGNAILQAEELSSAPSCLLCYDGLKSPKLWAKISNAFLNLFMPVILSQRCKTVQVPIYSLGQTTLMTIYSVKYPIS